MKLTETQQTELEKLVKALQEWMNENCHPHVVAIVDSENMELMEGITTVQRNQRGLKRENARLRAQHDEDKALLVMLRQDNHRLSALPNVEAQR